jgi:diguanylate cyclase (GGDEF)-like protein
VLVGFAERVQSELRKPDDFGRIGGEEFIALLPDTNAHSALALAERIRLKIADWQFAALKGTRLTTCIGIAEFSLQLQRMDELSAAADHALYQAKAQGRNCVRMY